MENIEKDILLVKDIPYEIPEHWVWAKIKNVIINMETKNPNKIVGEYFHYLDIDAINNKNQSINQIKKIKVQDAPSRARRKVLQGDVIISLVRPYLKNIAKINIQDEKLIASTAFYVCTPKEMLDTDFLYRYLCSPYVTQYLIGLTKGDNSPSVRNIDFEELYIPIPPLDEQKKINKKVDTLLCKIEEAKKIIAESKESFKMRRGAILDKAFRGELTEKWRELHSSEQTIDELLEAIRDEKEQMYLNVFNEFLEGKIKRPRRPSKYTNSIDNQKKIKDLPDTWGICTLGDIVYDFKYGTSAKSDYSSEGIPVLRIPNIGEEFIDLKDIKKIKQDTIDPNTSLLAGDILIVRSNGSKELVGKCSIVRESEENYTFASYLIRLRPILVVPEYILWLLKSNIIKEQLFSKSKSSSGINNINSQELAATIIPLPPIREQKEIIHKVKRIFDNENEIEELLEMSIQMEEIKDVILSKAFCGEINIDNP